MGRKEFISRSPSETHIIGENIGKEAKAGDIYCIYGELGSGKTELVKGIAKGLGIKEWAYVVSPTFTIINLYDGRLKLCHVDLFRIERSEFEDLHLEEYLDDSVVCIEWAEKGVFHEKVFKVFIDIISEKERRFVLLTPNEGG